jgi:bifunctional DNase/RNase
VVIDLLKMKVKAVGIEQESGVPIVILTDEAEKGVLPLLIGYSEARSISMVLDNVEVSRPLTHDLVISFIEILGGKVKRIEITDLIDDTYYAKIYIEADGKVHEVDARPSDAIALALRLNVDIFADEKVLNTSIKTEMLVDKEMEDFRKFLDEVSPEDFKKYY